MPIMNFNDFKELKGNGFQGFDSIQELWNDNAIIPHTQGVYLVLNKKKDNTEFLEEGVGDFFQGRNPNVPIDILTNEFVPNSLVVYIGKAKELRRRINQYLRFGRGLNAPHRGGRFIWQIRHHQELIVCWKELPENEDPTETESQLILEFRNLFNNQRPFANLQG